MIEGYISVVPARGNPLTSLSCTHTCPLVHKENSFLISMHIYFAQAVLSTLFHRILDIVKSDVRLVKSPG